MKKLFAILALTLLLVPGIALAQPPAGCLWSGDPCMRYGFGQYDGLPFNQPGNDFANVAAGATLTYILAPMNMTLATYTGGGCVALDTFCFEAYSAKGWTLVCDPPMGEAVELPEGGYIWYQQISITAPCDATVGTVDTLIAKMAYVNIAGDCAPECGDCFDPNARISNGQKYYNADTLIVTVVTSPPALAIYQDSITLVDQGATQAYIPFSICNQDACAPTATYDYNIKSKGHVGAALNTSGSVAVDGGDCKDIYGIINAGAAVECDYDTLTIIAWTTTLPVAYDTCVQLIHVITPEPVPLFTVPVVTILVLALILAAAVFMRRRAVSKA
jgi:hypothetical protein